MRHSAFPLALTAALWGSTALAQATPEGAAELTAVLQTYLGTTPGVVSVAPEGDAYGVKLDFALLLAKLPPEITGSLSPLMLQVTDNGDGTWDYSMDQSVTLSYVIGTEMSATTTYGSVKLTGVFDEALGDSSEYSLEATDITTEQTQTDPSMGGQVVIKGTVASMTYAGNAEAGEAGVDTTFTSTAKDMTYDVSFPAGEGMPPMSVTATIAEGGMEGTATGYRPQAVYGLLAWFVAHPDEAAMEADKAGLKAQIEGGLPFFDNISATGSYKTITVNSPVGPFGLQEAGVAIDMNGVVSEGLFREAISLKGLTIPEGIVPPFAADMVPTDLDIDMAVSGFDLAAPAMLGLGMLDLPAGTPPAPDFDMQMLGALLPTGAVDITLAPGGITAPGYVLSYEGAMSAGPMGAPSGDAKISLTGIEAIMTALQSAPPEMGAQDILPMIAMAQGLAKPEGDALVWEVNMAPTGAVSVNGMELVPGQQ